MVSSPMVATRTVRNVEIRATGPAVKTPLERVSAQTSSGKASSRMFRHREGRVKPASSHQPVHASRAKPSRIASAQNRVSGLFMSERIRPSPSGGSKAFCGSFDMSPTGAIGNTALLANVIPNKSSVTATEKNKGCRSPKRLTSLLLYAAFAPQCPSRYRMVQRRFAGRASGNRTRPALLELPFEASEDKVEAELELGVMIYPLEPSVESVDVWKVVRRE